MTLRCPECDCRDLDPLWDNGAEYPETRVERYECADCGYAFQEVLTA